MKGWRAVPVEFTKDWFAAMVKIELGRELLNMDREVFVAYTKRWAEFLAAAPSPPSAEPLPDERERFEGGGIVRRTTMLRLVMPVGVARSLVSITGRASRRNGRHGRPLVSSHPRPRQTHCERRGRFCKVGRHRTRRIEMGDVADMMLDGTLCEGCGDLMGGAVGYPRRCRECKDDEPAPVLKTPITNPNKTKCPACGKKVKKSGLQDHQRDVHGAETQEPT